MSKMETRRSTRELRCVDEQGNEHTVLQQLEEARVWLAHGHWSNWGTRQELLMLGSEQVQRLDAAQFRTMNSGRTLRLAEPT